MAEVISLVGEQSVAAASSMYDEVDIPDSPSTEVEAKSSSSSSSYQSTTMVTVTNGGVQICTPQVLWHGGGQENGKTDPVYSIDFHPLNVLATAGIDANVPPKGSVRLWKITTAEEQPEFLIELNADHIGAVNGVRFSPCGKMLATASSRQIVIYKVPEAATWPTVTDPKQLEKIFIRPSLEEIFDIQWSPDSCFVLAGAINSRAEIVRVLTKEKESLVLCGHTGYVQGVAWDPRNEVVVTQSADRSCKVHSIKQKPGMMVKLAGRGHVVAKMLAHTGYALKQEVEACSSTAADPFNEMTSTNETTTELSDKDNTQQTQIKPKNLYADATVPSFFRRPTFSPDGAILITPTGIHRPFQDTTNDENKNASSNGSGSSGRQLTSYIAPEMKKSFCTYIFTRSQYAIPAISLYGLEEPSIAVRCSPVLYKMIESNASSSTSSSPKQSSSGGVDVSSLPSPPIMISGRYRMIFAVITISSIMIYTTQYEHPIARFGGLHLACINDATWSADGRMLVVCSSDGYLSFLRFPEGTLGEPLAEEDVPLTVKRAHPYLYHYVDPNPTASAETSTDPAGASSSSSTSSATGESGSVKDCTEVATAVEAGTVSPPKESVSDEKKDETMMELESTEPQVATGGEVVQHSDIFDTTAAVVNVNETLMDTEHPIVLSETTEPSSSSSRVIASASAMVTANAIATAITNASMHAIRGNEGVESGEKKRKRITPTVVGSLGSVPTSAGNVAPVIKDGLDTPATMASLNNNNGVGDNSQLSVVPSVPSVNLHQSPSFGVTVASLVSRATSSRTSSPAPGNGQILASSQNPSGSSSETKTKKRITPILVSSQDAAFAHTTGTTIIGSASMTIPVTTTTSSSPVVCEAMLTVSSDGVATYTTNTST